jgi:prepilin-type N-terminal cleavage/methylation domain-containing protein
VKNSNGFTLLELVVVIGVVAVLAAVGIVGYRQARLRGAEAAAVVALNAINQAQFAYMQTCGQQRYAPTLAALGTPAPGHDTGFISPDLAASDPLIKSGYVFSLSGTEATEGERTCTGLVPLERYRLTADPASPGGTGRFFYGTNTDRVIYADGASFLEDMPEQGPPNHGAEIK